MRAPPVSGRMMVICDVRRVMGCCAERRMLMALAPCVCGGQRRPIANCDAEEAVRADFGKRIREIRVGKRVGDCDEEVLADAHPSHRAARRTRARRRPRGGRQLDERARRQRAGICHRVCACGRRGGRRMHGELGDVMSK